MANRKFALSIYIDGVTISILLQKHKVKFLFNDYSSNFETPSWYVPFKINEATWLAIIDPRLIEIETTLHGKAMLNGQAQDLLPSDRDTRCGN